MRKIGGIIEGLILLFIGAYAGLLILSGNYWRFLNPKFKWLTGTTAIMLMLVGAIAAFKPNKKPGLGRRYFPNPFDSAALRPFRHNSPSAD